MPTPIPPDDEVLVKTDTIGVSMPEVLVRRGTYAWMPPLPAIPGIEPSGKRCRRTRDASCRNFIPHRSLEPGFRDIAVGWQAGEPGRLLANRQQSGIGLVGSKLAVSKS